MIWNGSGSRSDGECVNDDPRDDERDEISRGPFQRGALPAVRACVPAEWRPNIAGPREWETLAAMRTSHELRPNEMKISPTADGERDKQADRIKKESKAPGGVGCIVWLDPYITAGSKSICVETRFHLPCTLRIE